MNSLKVDISECISNEIFENDRWDSTVIADRILKLVEVRLPEKKNPFPESCGEYNSAIDDVRRGLGL